MINMAGTLGLIWLVGIFGIMWLLRLSLIWLVQCSTTCYFIFMQRFCLMYFYWFVYSYFLFGLCLRTCSESSDLLLDLAFPFLFFFVWVRESLSIYEHFSNTYKHKLWMFNQLFKPSSWFGFPFSFFVFVTESLSLNEHFSITYNIN